MKNDEPIWVVGVGQEFQFPSAYSAQKKSNKSQFELQSAIHQLQLRTTEYEVKKSFYQYQFELHKYLALKRIDSLLDNFSEREVNREAQNLEELTILYKQKKWKIGVYQAKEDISIAMNELKRSAYIDKEIEIQKIDLGPINMKSATNEPLVVQNIFNSREMGQINEVKSLRRQALPDWSVGYFQGTNPGIDENLIGYEFGLKLPLWYGARKAEIRSSQIEMEKIQDERQQLNFELSSKRKILIDHYQKYKEFVDLFEEDGEDLTDRIIAES